MSQSFPDDEPGKQGDVPIPTPQQLNPRAPDEPTAHAGPPPIQSSTITMPKESNSGGETK